MLKSHPEGTVLHLHVQPGASKTGIAGLYGDALKVRVHAPPVDGKANKALLGYLAKIFDLPPSRLRLLKGETGRKKSVLIKGMDVPGATAMLSGALPA